MLDELGRAVAHMKRGVESFPWTDVDAYAGWLTQTYFYVSHSTRLLAAAAARFDRDPRGDALHYRFVAHIREERRHEQLALTDLKRLGRPTDKLVEYPSTRLFYEPQYYKIDHVSPVVLFGYILPLEAIAPECGRAILPLLQSAHNERAVTFLQVHTDEDPDHIQKALAALEQATARERAFIRDNMEQTAAAYVHMLSEIRERASARP
jgi:hypothetical protein